MKTLRVAVWAVLLAACGAKSADHKPEEHPPATTIDAAPAKPPAESAADFLARAQMCTADADCVYIGDLCEWGCAVTVNKKFASEAPGKLENPSVRCNIDCPNVGPPVCAHGTCTSPAVR